MKHSVLFVLLISVAPVGGLAQIVVPDPDEPNQFVISPEAEDDDAEERIRAPKKRKKPAADSVATPEITAIFLAQLEDGGDACDRAPSPYRIDCVSEQFAALARNMPRTGDYAEARQVLQEASRDLKALVRGNREAGGASVSIEVETATGGSAVKRLSAVAAERQAEVTAAATAIIEEAATVLLRSRSATEERASAFTQIAEAVDSTKVLLRS